LLGAALAAVAAYGLAWSGPAGAASVAGPIVRVFYVVDYTGHMSGRVVATTRRRGVTSIGTETFHFSLSCAQVYPGQACELRGTMSGFLSGTYPGTSGSGNCKLAFGLASSYNKNPLTVEPFNDFGRPTPFRHFGAAPLIMQEEQYWSKKIPVQFNGGCPGWFGWDSAGRKAGALGYASRALINISTGAQSGGVTNVSGRPTGRGVTGFSKYHGKLTMQLLADPYYWWAQSASRSAQDILQGILDGLQAKQTPPSSTAEMPGLPPNAGHAMYDASGTLVGFQATTGRGVRREQATAARTVPLFTISQEVGSAPTPLTVRVTPAGRAALGRLTRPTTVHMTGTITAAGRSRPASDTFTLTPVGSPVGTITSVEFVGSSAHPSFIVRGSAFGSEPAPSPADHPSGLNGCPVVAGDNGYDYGTNLYIVVPAKDWSGGRYDPAANETDCVDLVVTKFTPTEVDFHFGPFYAANHPKLSLDNGDQMQVAVNGAEKTVHVAYGTTATN